MIYGRLSGRNREAIYHYIEQRTIQLYEGGKYPAFQKETEQITVEGAKVVITVRGKVRIPFWREKILETESQAAMTDPITIIREARRIE